MVIQRLPPRKDGFVPRTSGALSMVLVLVVVLGVWFLNGRDPGTGTIATDPGSSSSASADPSPGAAESESEAGAESGAEAEPSGTDPRSGLPVVGLGELPPEAFDTVDLIDSGGPFPYGQDGSTFGNFEGYLPDESRGYYAEFTVETPGSEDRGARRIVAGDEGELYWTEDHYDSFEAIRR